MLPRFPDQLRHIDASLLADHSQLGPTDQCDFLWEYVPRQRMPWNAANQLIRNLKLKPSVLALRPSRLRYKRAAIAHASRALRRLLPPGWVSEVTFIPMPCSKVRGGCDHDDRMARVLRRAFGRGADIRELLYMGHSLTADHESQVRCSAARLRRALRLRRGGIDSGNGESGASGASGLDACGGAAAGLYGVRDAPVITRPRRTIVLVDDILNSGKHFRVASSLLQRRWPECEVRGLFLARCVRPSGGT